MQTDHRWLSRERFKRSPITPSRRAMGTGLLSSAFQRGSICGPGVPAVSITIGMCAVAACDLRRRHKATPSSTGIIQSVTMRSGCSADVTLTAASPSDATRTRYPLASSTVRRSSRMRASSSTSRIVSTSPPVENHRGASLEPVGLSHRPEPQLFNLPYLGMSRSAFSRSKRSKNASVVGLARQCRWHRRSVLGDSS